MTSWSQVLSIVSPAPGTYRLTVTRSAGPTDAVITVHRFGDAGHPLQLFQQSLRLGPGDAMTIPVNYSVLAGDLNADGVRDGLDVSIVRRAAGSARGTPGWNPVADTTGDGRVLLEELTEASAVPFGAALSVTPDAAIYSAGNVMQVSASLAAGSTPVAVDAYIVVQTPAGQYFSLQLGAPSCPGSCRLHVGSPRSTPRQWCCPIRCLAASRAARTRGTGADRPRYAKPCDALERGHVHDKVAVSRPSGERVVADLGPS